jgi:O-antigen/teichoic acid export membrane protein
MFYRILKLLGGMTMYSASQWLMISLLAHLGGPVPVGQLSLALSIVTPLAILSSLSSRMLLQMDGRSDDEVFRDYWHLRLATTVLFFVAVFGVLLWRKDDASFTLSILIVAVFRGVENLSDVLCGLAQNRDNQSVLSLSLSFRGLGTIVPFGIVYLLTKSLPAALASVAVSWAFVFLNDWRLTRHWHGDLSTIAHRQVAGLAWRSLPIGVSVFLSGFGIVAPRLVLESHTGVEALGVFSALTYTITLGNLFVGAISNSMLRDVASYWQAGNTKAFFNVIAKSTILLTVMCVIGVILAALFGKWILLVLYGPKFAAYTTLFTVVAIAASFVLLAGLWGYMVVGTNSAYFQLWSNVAIVGVALASSYALIPKFGIWGAVSVLFVISLTKIILTFANIAYVLRRDRSFRISGSEPKSA